MDSAAFFQLPSLLNPSPDDAAPTQCGPLTSPFPESVFQKGTARSWVIRENAETAQNLRGGWPLDGSCFLGDNFRPSHCRHVIERETYQSLWQPCVPPPSLEPQFKEKRSRRSVFATKLSKGAVAGCRATPPPLWITEP